jgi:predicted dehydrogenase/threonine dehydrogenase-like Zn-dependent dehydrogenase
MKQVLRKGLKDIVVEEVPDPVASAHHVLVRPLYSLISSGTETADLHTDGVLKEVADNPSHLRKVWDVMKVAGPLKTVSEVRAKFEEYAALGYSGAGVVVDKHASVGDLEVGDRVAYGGEGTGHGETVLAGRNLVVRVPDNVPFEHACFTTLGSIAMNSVRIAQIGVGETVAVIGLGLVGQLVAQLARVQGGVVVAIDVKPERVELARAAGADFALVGGAGAPAEVAALTNGRGADVVIVAAASKSAAPVQQAVKLCRDRGRLIIVGAVPLELPRDEMYIKELQLLMSRAYGPGSYDPAYEKRAQDYPLAYVRWTENRNMEEFLRLASRGRLELERLITHRFALEAAAEGYSTIMDPAANSLAVILRYPAAERAERGETKGETAAFEPQRRLKTGAPKSAALRVGLVGAGNLARWEHLPNLKKIPGVALHAVHSASGARGKTYGERFGAAYASTDYEELLNDPQIDVVLIATRHEHHFAQAERALRAGKHVFIEKPMAVTVDECRTLHRTVAETGRRLSVGFNRRFAPFYQEMKRALGRRTGPAVVNCRMNSPGLSGSFWAADPAFGGAVVGEGCHFVDLMYWLLESEPVEVSAFSLPLDRDEPIGQNNVVASLRFADGSVGSLTYCTVGSRSSGGERVEVFAPGVGVATEDFKRLTVKAGAASTRSRLFAEKGYAAQMSAFMRALMAGEEPEVTARDGARATIVCVRLLESARGSEPRAIDLDALLGA